MIKLMFTYNKDVLTFVVKSREIWFTDKSFGKMLVKCLPPQDDILRVIALSRNRVPASLISMFKFTTDEIKEYEGAQNEEELAQIIIKDAASKGVVLQHKEVIQ